MTKSKQLLIIGFVWPEPASSAAGSRMMQLIRYFKDQQWDITFASASNKTPHTADLESLGITMKSIEINDETFDQFVKELQPGMVLFDRFMTEEQFGWRVHAAVPGAVRLLDMEDLHCLRHGRQMAVNEGREFTETDLISDLSMREIASIYRCDLSLIISEHEMDLLRSFFDIDWDLLAYMPYFLQPITPKQKRSWPGFEERNRFISIGNFRHKPNLDSVLYLKEEIWPFIRKKLRGAEINLYGAYPSQSVRQLHDPDNGFLIKGRAKDSKEVLRSARVLLAPLRFGAGLKGKLTEAMLCGTPSVTTSIGAEGINGYLGWPGEITDHPEKFAAEAVRLMTSPAEWSVAQQRGIDIINRRFRSHDFRDTLTNRIEEIRKKLSTHRHNNFTGAMLMHHTMASTRFMTRWIEEKNKP
ncbi:MAG: glycosyltransferase [Bacteroidetes bacterium]|nr:glycosyltransferase [Bacteroidota bacterium]